MFNFDRQFIICIILIVLAVLFILLTKMLVLCFRRNNCFYRKIQNMDKTHTMSERRAIKKSLDIIMENTYKGVKTPDNLMAPGKIIEKEFSGIDFDDNGFMWDFYLESTMKAIEEAAKNGWHKSYPMEGYYGHIKRIRKFLKRKGFSAHEDFVKW